MRWGDRRVTWGKSRVIAVLGLVNHKDNNDSYRITMIVMIMIIMVICNNETLNKKDENNIINNDNDINENVNTNNDNGDDDDSE